MNHFKEQQALNKFLTPRKLFKTIGYLKITINMAIAIFIISTKFETLK